MVVTTVNDGRGTGDPPVRHAHSLTMQNLVWLHVVRLAQRFGWGETGALGRLSAEQAADLATALASALPDIAEEPLPEGAEHTTVLDPFRGHLRGLLDAVIAFCATGPVDIVAGEPMDGDD